MLIALAHGANFDAPEKPFDQLKAPAGQPSIADIAAQIEPPRGGGDTLAASRAALGILTGKERPDGGDTSR